MNSINPMDYHKYFKTGQYERLYIVAGGHAHGKTFRIYVLPLGEKAKSNGPNNAPRNSNAVEVFGVICGQPGWDEHYGWLYNGKWKEDFLKIAAELREKYESQLMDEQYQNDAMRITGEEKKLALLGDY